MHNIAIEEYVKPIVCVEFVCSCYILQSVCLLLNVIATAGKLDEPIPRTHKVALWDDVEHVVSWC